MSDLAKKIHDIRKPLNTITMQAELIKMLSEAGASNEKIEESANKIIQNARQSSELLQAIYESASLKNKE
jgi:signal transduction histidine kinase